MDANEFANISPVASEYLSLEPLQTRIDTHRRYSEREDDVEQAVLDEIALEPDEALLDVGCGTGSFLRRLRQDEHRGRLVGLDTSPAAIDALAGSEVIEGVVCDATAQPFADGEFDVVTARHMLYHVPDLDAALREARRVLRAGGRFAAVVNLPDNATQVCDLVGRVVRSHGLEPPELPNERVNTETLPPAIARIFGHVAATHCDNALLFPTPEALANYAVSLLSFYGVEPASPERPAVADEIVAEAERWFATHDAPWRDRKGYGVFTALRT